MIFRPVSTPPPQGEARCSLRACQLGFVRSAFWYVFATVLNLPSSTPALSHFVFVSIFLYSSCFPFSLAPFPSRICENNSFRACRSRHSLECSVPGTLFLVFRSSFVVFY